MAGTASARSLASVSIRPVRMFSWSSLVHLFSPHRSAAKIALRIRCARRQQRLVLGLGLDTFSNHLRAKVACDCNNPFNEINATRIGLVHELPVNLHIVKREPADPVQIAMLRTEIVDRKPDTVRGCCRRSTMRTVAISTSIAAPLRCGDRCGGNVQLAMSNFIRTRSIDGQRMRNGKQKGEGNTRNGNPYLCRALIEAANSRSDSAPKPDSSKSSDVTRCFA